ncbi:endonuclease domain-containing protein [Candidatus Uhrbacteria bacterium]|nr:endonuclease domain-containing protein [Candidatus Uhrbacteria bacterium]
MVKLFNPNAQKSTRQKLRSRMTRSEKILWYYLRGSNVEGYKFRRQQGIGPHVVDFYCPRVKLVVELDGDSHYQEGAKRRDAQRQKFIEAQGIRVLRFTDNDVCENVGEVIAGIIKELSHHP